MSIGCKHSCAGSCTVILVFLCLFCVLLVRIYVLYYSITFGVWYCDTYSHTLPEGPCVSGPVCPNDWRRFWSARPVFHQALFSVFGLRPRGFTCCATVSLTVHKFCVEIVCYCQILVTEHDIVSDILNWPFWNVNNYSCKHLSLKRKLLYIAACFVNISRCKWRSLFPFRYKQRYNVRIM